jgi:hypothetical protein
MAVLFAAGTVSGTVLSYELGLLWPKLMGIYGPAFGIPFSAEAVWFFVEAIFTAIYLYGWRRLPAWLHWWTGMPLVISGVLGAFSVVAANAWMNQPSGFTLAGGWNAAPASLRAPAARPGPPELRSHGRARHAAAPAVGGRQPWVVYGYLLTKDAVAPSAGVPVTLAVVLPLYAVLTAVVVGVPWMMGRRWRFDAGNGGEPSGGRHWRAMPGAGGEVTHGRARTTASGDCAFTPGSGPLWPLTCGVQDAISLSPSSSSPGSGPASLAPRASVMRWFAASACPSMQCA